MNRTIAASTLAAVIAGAALLASSAGATGNYVYPGVYVDETASPGKVMPGVDKTTSGYFPTVRVAPASAPSTQNPERQAATHKKLKWRKPL